MVIGIVILRTLEYHFVTSISYKFSNTTTKVLLNFHSKIIPKWSKNLDTVCISTEKNGAPQSPKIPNWLIFVYER